MYSNRRDFIKAAAALGLSINVPSANYLVQNTGSLPRSSPEAQGFDSQALLNFLSAAKESGLEWHSFMLVKNGFVIAEGWWKPFAATHKHTLYSLSKSFTSTAIGLLVDEGKLNVSDQVIKFFPESLPAEVSDNLKAMQVQHLLTMNTGHDSDTMPELRKNSHQSWVKSFLAHPVIHAPASHFLYNTGATYMLGAIVHKVTGLTLEQYLKPRLFDPLAISGYDWEKSPEGLNTAGYGLRVSTEDIAKFGQLYLQKGKWAGKQLLSEAWVEAASKKQTSSQAGDNDWAQGYGYQFWRCKPGFYRGDGAYGQFCMVMPEYNTVLALTNESFNMQKSMDVVYETLLPGIRQSTLPANNRLVEKLKAESASLSLPVAKGSKTSALHSKYSNKTFKLETNPFGLTEIGFGLFDDAGVLRVNMGKGVEKIGFGWETWRLNPNKRLNPFVANQNTATAVTSRIAATATWLNSSTLQIHMKFVDQIHGDKLTCTFNDNQVQITFLSSIAEGNKNNVERREKLIGNLV